MYGSHPTRLTRAIPIEITKVKNRPIRNRKAARSVEGSRRNRKKRKNRRKGNEKRAEKTDSMNHKTEKQKKKSSERNEHFGARI